MLFSDKLASVFAGTASTSGASDSDPESAFSLLFETPELDELSFDCSFEISFSCYSQITSSLSSSMGFPFCAKVVTRSIR